MRSILAVAGLLAAIHSASASPAQVLERAACNGDNCLNAVKKVSAVNSKDCRSFMTRTTTPCPYSTTTVTSTATFTTTVGSISHDAAVRPPPPAPTVTSGTCPAATANSVVPTYASACSGVTRYSSACSCLGVTAGTTTIASPLATATATATTTTTVTAVCSTFLATATSGPYTGQYLAFNLLHNYYAHDRSLSFISDISQADLIIAQGNHFYGGGSVNASRIWRGGSSGSYVSEDESFKPNPLVNPVLNCTLTGIRLDGTASIFCLTDGYPQANVFQTCPNSGADTELLLYDHEIDEGEGTPCIRLDLATIPRC